MTGAPPPYRTRFRRSIPCGLAVAGALLLGTLSARAAPTASFVGVLPNSSDYAPSGADLGADGYWFAHFDAASPLTNQAVDRDAVDELPSWIVADFDPGSSGYSFPGTATSTGGQLGHATLTLPDGTTGLAGQLVNDVGGDPALATLFDWNFGPGTPSQVVVSIVLDTAPENGVGELLVRQSDASMANVVDATADAATMGAFRDGAPDVYQFVLGGLEVGGGLTVRLAPSFDSESPAISGILFQPVPEPGPAVLIASGLAVLALRRRSPRLFRHPFRWRR